LSWRSPAVQLLQKERDSGLSLNTLAHAHNHSESPGNFQPGVSV
jgi:hypothetical protein